jgi:hydrogenase maturation protease
VVIGIGNGMRGDDAAGLHVARRLRARAARRRRRREHEGETLALLERWGDADAVILVDAVRSDAPPGTVRRLDASARSLPARLLTSSSTHGVRVAEAIELARALHRLPARVILYGVEGRRFDAGSGLSAEVEAAIDPLADAVARDAHAAATAA